MRALFTTSRGIMGFGITSSSHWIGYSTSSSLPSSFLFDFANERNEHTHLSYLLFLWATIYIIYGAAFEPPNNAQDEILRYRRRPDKLLAMIFCNYCTPNEVRAILRSGEKLNEIVQGFPFVGKLPSEGHVVQRDRAHVLSDHLMQRRISRRYVESSSS